MIDDRGRRRWSNVPVPEPHVAGLIGGLVLHLIAPRRACEPRRPVRATGAVLIAVGSVIVEWAVRTAGSRDLECPTVLETGGPYAFSRNPMYVAWTVLYVGVALLANTAWLFLGLPVVVAATHRVVRREERTLERTFGDAYRDYRRGVRRYL